VKFYVDGTSVGSDTEAPFGITWDASGYAAGEHTVKATATSTGGETADSEEVAVNIGEVELGPEIGSWTATTAFTTGRASHTSVVHNGYVYVLGGFDDGSNYLNDVQYAKINADGTIGSWNNTTSFTTVRDFHTSVVHNGYVYVLGGFDGSNKLNDVQYAKINADGTVGPWNSTTSFTTERGGHTSVVYNGYLYVIGGSTDLSNYFNDVQYAKIKADGTVGPWNSTTPFITSRWGHTSVVLNGYVYVIGGLDDGANRLNDVQYAKINADGTVGTWNTTTPFITGRNSHTSVVHNGYVYVIGGVNDGANHLNDVQYAKINADGTVGPWNSTTSFVTERSSHTSVVHNGYVYVIGGNDGANEFNDVQYTSFLE
jgi:N-acetylneuraminic acid mutarotase